MKILGIDYGLNTGFAIIDFNERTANIVDSLNIKLLHEVVSKNQLLYKRLEHLHNLISDICAHHNITLAAIESLGNAKDENPILLHPQDITTINRLWRSSNHYYEQAIETLVNLKILHY